MLIVISPAKKLDFKSAAPVSDFTQPDHLDHAAELIAVMQEKDSFEIADLMKLSMNLADLNMERFQQWHTPFTPDNAKQAIFAFTGDVYQGLDAGTLDGDATAFLQQHLRILSGLYGTLRPLDLMQPYRLEMGTRLANERGRNLYEFWGNIITESLNKALAEQGDDILINLASTEYFSAVKTANIKGSIITPVFKELRKGSYRIISFNAKKARGYMSRFIIENRLSDPEALKSFDVADYAFNEELSSSNEFVFTR
ncbi:peroxide stress protein YaaA [Mariprofundus sp. NF]|uniref:peroxide stress protein YaaA n=1 Tax=Mariprofundus sp. NF TaxID=2608716 RepID=UPI0015A09441|nr:peroxide stress protein YaaA [Mariprofundus sp. NF]NWF37718.1 peroxide stress protein YaaA [Mariprofundus sp. NF]